MPRGCHQADTEPGLEKWLEVNTEYAKAWQTSPRRRNPRPTPKDFEGMEGKFEKYFSKEPGSGD